MKEEANGGREDREREREIPHVNKNILISITNTQRRRLHKAVCCQGEQGPRKEGRREDERVKEGLGRKQGREGLGER